MNLDASIDVTVGEFHLLVDLRVAAGDVVAVLGPNAAGKTTLLRALAGLASLDSGRITLGDRVLDDPSAGIFVPPERRPVGVVFQDYLLFPHLSVRDNVAFGAPAGRRAADDLLARVGLADRAGARPSELSGGQAQRVALARALAAEPSLLLLDEPLAALDAGTRRDMRRELHQLLADFSGVRVLITHDPVDAFSLADRIVVVEGGRVTQEGTPAEVAARPRSAYVADVFRTNVVRGSCTGGVVSTVGGATIVSASSVEGPVLAVIPPAAVSIHRRAPDGSPRNVWHGTIDHIERLVDRIHVHVRAPFPILADITPGSADALELRDGDDVWLAVKAVEVDVYPV